MRQRRIRYGLLALAAVLLLGVAAVMSGCVLPGPQGALPTLAPSGSLIASQDADLTATAAIAARLTSTASPTLTLKPTVAPSATPKPTNTLAAATATATAQSGCAIAVDDKLLVAYGAAGGNAKLGCPAAVAADEPWALQPFEHGVMFWRGVEKAIYLARADGSFNIRADLWTESQPEYSCAANPPAGFLQPKRGFGLLWCESDINAYFGWAIIEETGITYRTQRFQNAAGDFALLLVPEFGPVYVFYTDYTWADVMTVEP